MRDINIKTRRVLLWIILKIPQGVRTWLSRNTFLTRIFIYFDNAKYEPLSTASGSTGNTDTAPRFGGTTTTYQYKPAERPPEQSAEGGFSSCPLITVLMPVNNTRPEWLDAAIQSLRNQWYERWELVIIDDASDASE